MDEWRGNHGGLVEEQQVRVIGERASDYCQRMIATIDQDSVAYLYQKVVIVGASTQVSHEATDMIFIAGAIAARRGIDREKLDGGVAVVIASAFKVQRSKAVVFQESISSNCEGDALVYVVGPLDAETHAGCSGWVGSLVALGMGRQLSITE